MLIAILSSVVLAGCSTTSTPNSQTTEKTQTKSIKIGLIAPLSGPASTYGEDTVNAMNLAIEEYNSKTNGPAIELVIEDGKCNGADATSAALKLINVDKVPLMFGGVCSSEALAASKIAQENGIVSVVAASQSPNLSTIGDHVFRYSNGIVAANLISSLSKDKKNIILISEKTEFAQSIAQKIRENIWTSITTDIQYETAEKDLTIIAKRIKDASRDSDLIIYIPQSETASINMIKAFDKEWIRESLKGKIIGYPFLSSPSFLKNMWDSANWLYNVTCGPLLTEWSTAKKYHDIIEQKYGIKSVLYVWSLSLEAMQTVLDAISKWARSSNDFKVYFNNIIKEKPRNGMIWSYYFSGSEGTGVPYILEKIEGGAAKVVTNLD